jgi:suppressor of tumorigenicity protein 13
MTSINTLYSSVPATATLLQSLIENTSLLNDDKFKPILALAKRLASVEVPPSDGFDDAPASSCGHDHSHGGQDHAHSHDHHAEEKPKAKAAPETAAFDVDDDDKMEPESAAFPQAFTNAGDAAAEALTDDDFAKHQDLQSTAKAAANGAAPEEAIKQLTLALSAEAAMNQLSAMTYAKRGDALLLEKRPMAAKADAEAAVLLNPDSAKGLRLLGMCQRYLGDYLSAAKTLGSAQNLDFSDSIKTTQDFLKSIVAMVQQGEAAQREAEKAEMQEKIKARKAANEKARAAAAASAASEASPSGGGMPAGMGGMPGMGGGGGGGGMGLPPGFMEAMASDPELAASMQDPEVQAKFAEIMQNPMSMMQHMGDPKLGPLIQKMMGMMGGGGMGGMPGGMGGMGGMGGDMGEGVEEVDDEDTDDEMPDLD